MARISIKRLVESEKEFAISINSECDNCGICVRNCVYGALMQDRSKEDEDQK